MLKIRLNILSELHIRSFTRQSKLIASIAKNEHQVGWTWNFIPKKKESAK